MAFFGESLYKIKLLSGIKFISGSFCRRYPAPRKRFYRNVFITESDGRYEVNLDKHKLKTPLGSLFQLPNEALAVAVATEWDLQKDILKQENMHITSLCNTALDNPCQQSKQSLADATLQFLAADTLCYRSTDPPDLLSLQGEQWDPYLKWFQNRFSVNINICQDVGSNPVPKETLEEIRKHLLSYNEWCLYGINFAAENLKSLILTSAVINHTTDVDMAVALSRLETLFQVKRWGNVDWFHDVDEAQTTSRVAAAALFVYLNEGLSSSFRISSTKVQSAAHADMHK